VQDNREEKKDPVEQGRSQKMGSWGAVPTPIEMLSRTAKNKNEQFSDFRLNFS